MKQDDDRKTKTMPIQIMWCFKKQKQCQYRSCGASKNKKQCQYRSCGASKNKNSVNTDNVVLQNSLLIWNTQKKAFIERKKGLKTRIKRKGKE